QIGDFSGESTYPYTLNDSLKPVMDNIARNEGVQAKAPAKKPAASPAPAAPAASSSASPAGALFELIGATMKSDPSISKGLNAIFVYNLKSSSGAVSTWTIDGKGNSVYSGAPPAGTKAD